MPNLESFKLELFSIPVSQQVQLSFWTD